MSHENDGVPTTAEITEVSLLAENIFHLARASTSPGVALSAVMIAYDNLCLHLGLDTIECLEAAVRDFRQHEPS